ncbi:dockerin type I domain-containing protein [bacterium]|nr:dockerin type I domain-containing protein [bacterium]
MNIQNLLITSIIATAAPMALAGDTPTDTYSGGYALAVLPEEFVLAGAIPLGVNFDFPGNPALPVVNGGVTPALDPTTFGVVGFMQTTSQDNGDGTYSVGYETFTADGAPFVTKGMNTLVPTATGLQEATDLVIDLGNGYENPNFPINGVDICGDEGDIFIGVEYYFVRTDGSENREFGDTSGSYIGPEGFTFAWGYDIADARTFNRAGFIATFAAVSCEGDGCFGDLNEDGEVNSADIGLMLSAWGSCGKAGPGCFGDLNEDGQVNGTDIGLILGAWGICP